MPVKTKTRARMAKAEPKVPGWRRDAPRVSHEQYLAIRELAQQYILQGGGVLDHKEVINTSDPIWEISDRFFDGKARQHEFDALLNQVHNDDLPISVDPLDLEDAVLALMNARIDAAFAFGAAVGLQLVHPNGAKP